MTHRDVTKIPTPIMAEISENKPAKCLVLHFYHTRNIKDFINKIMVASWPGADANWTRMKCATNFSAQL